MTVKRIIKSGDSIKSYSDVRDDNSDNQKNDDESNDNGGSVTQLYNRYATV